MMKKTIVYKIMVIDLMTKCNKFSERTGSMGIQVEHLFQFVVHIQLLSQFFILLLFPTYFFSIELRFPYLLNV